MTRGEAGSPLVPLPPDASTSPCRAGVWERAGTEGVAPCGSGSTNSQRQGAAALASVAQGPPQQCGQPRGCHRRYPSRWHRRVGPAASVTVNDGQRWFRRPAPFFPPALKLRAALAGGRGDKEQDRREKIKGERGLQCTFPTVGHPRLAVWWGYLLAVCGDSGCDTRSVAQKDCLEDCYRWWHLRLHHRAAPHPKAWTGTPAGYQVVSGQVRIYSTMGCRRGVTAPSCIQGSLLTAEQIARGPSGTRPGRPTAAPAGAWE